MHRRAARTQVPPTSPLGTLDTARKVLVATAAYGAGTYSQALGVTLTIPAQSRVGVYTGILPITLNEAGLATVMFDSDQGTKVHQDCAPDYTITDLRDLLKILDLP